MPQGFLDRFKEILNEVKFALEVGQVRMASEPQYSVAKGSLIAAVAEEERRQKE